MDYHFYDSGEHALQITHPEIVRGKPRTETREHLRVLILGRDRTYEHFHRILVANIQNWGYEAVLLPPLAMDPSEYKPEMEGDVLLYDMDVSLPQMENRWERGYVSLLGAEQVSAEPVWPRTRLLVALSSSSVSRLSLEQLGAVTLLHKPLDMGHLERYLRVFQLLFYAKEEQPQEYISAASSSTGHVQLLCAEENTVSAGASLAPTQPVRILVADDRHEVTQVIHQCLRKDKKSGYGYEVREVHDGLALLEQCLVWHPQCVVTDLLMPWLNGYQVLHCLTAGKLQSMPAFVIISVLTHYEIPVTRSYLQDNVVLYVDKPFEVESLLAAIEQALTLC